MPTIYIALFNHVLIITQALKQYNKICLHLSLNRNAKKNANRSLNTNEQQPEGYRSFCLMTLLLLKCAVRRVRAGLRIRVEAVHHLCHLAASDRLREASDRVWDRMQIRYPLYVRAVPLCSVIIVLHVRNEDVGDDLHAFDEVDVLVRTELAVRVTVDNVIHLGNTEFWAVPSIAWDVREEDDCRTGGNVATQTRICPERIKEERVDRKTEELSAVDAPVWLKGSIIVSFDDVVLAEVLNGLVVGRCCWDIRERLMSQVFRMCER